MGNEKGRLRALRGGEGAVSAVLTVFTILGVPMLVMMVVVGVLKLGTEARLLAMLLLRWTWTGIGGVEAAAMVPS